MSSSEPETMITLMGRGSIEQPPDVAVINAGITDRRDGQTGNMSLNPVSEYPNNARPRLSGCQAVRHRTRLP